MAKDKVIGPGAKSEPTAPSQLGEFSGSSSMPGACVTAIKEPEETRGPVGRMDRPKKYPHKGA